MKIRNLSVALAFFLSSWAFAQNQAQSSTGDSYIAVDVGVASYSGVTVLAGTYPNPGALTLAYGRKVNDHFSLEMGGTLFGDSAISGTGYTATISASSLFARVAGEFPITDSFSLTGNLGFGHNEQKLRVITAVSTSLSDSSNGVIGGVGVKYKFNDRFSVFANYEDYGSFGTFASTTGKLTATTASIGASYRF